MKLNYRYFPIFCLSIFIISCTCFSSNAFAITSTIRNVPSEYPTIQAGINAAVSGDTVIVSDGTYKGVGNKNLDFGGKAITVSSASGNPENCIIDCEESGRGFNFHRGEGIDSIVSGFKIMNGHSDWGGGVYCFNSSPTIQNCIISGNSVESGGGVYCTYLASPTIQDCIISSNVAENWGGGVFSFNSSPIIRNSNISDNSANQGGGVYLNMSSPTIENCTINGNSTIDDGDGYWASDGGGGGVFCTNGSPSVQDCIISNNSASGGGGGVYCELSSSPPALENCTINGNSAGLNGGGIYLSNSSPTIENCTINDNSTDQSGGGVLCVGSSSPIIQNCTISSNSADRSGGGVLFDNNTLPSVKDCIISDNSANQYGGGVYLSNSSPAIENCTINGNSAGLNGGGVYCFYQSSPIIQNCIISDNSANQYGGGLYCWSSASPTIQNSTISSNSADENGGGIVCVSSSKPTLTNTILENNSGGAIYEWDESSDPILRYCLFFNNPDGDYFDKVGPWSTSIDIYTGETFSGSGLSDTNVIPECSNNLYGDPMLRLGDYYPESCLSAAVDTGTSENAPDTDIEGTSRPQGIGYDIGAYEEVFPDTDADGIYDECDNCLLNYNPDQTDTDNDGIGDICEGDLNQDGVIDANDFASIISCLDEPSQEECSYGDLNGDGEITILDVRQLIVENPMLARDRRLRRLLR